jgi:hypothetical protein
MLTTWSQVPIPEKNSSKSLIKALDKAGIQIKASKVEFSVEEITFHNYRVIGGDGPLANITTPKDETLDPIRSCSIPQSVLTQLKAFLGSTQQMAQYVPYYELIAAPLHKLTRKGEVFPTGSKWIPVSVDLACQHVRSLMLDRPLSLHLEQRQLSVVASSKLMLAMTAGEHDFINMQVKLPRTKMRASSSF